MNKSLSRHPIAIHLNSIAHGKRNNIKYLCYCILLKIIHLLYLKLINFGKNQNKTKRWDVLMISRDGKFLRFSFVIITFFFSFYINNNNRRKVDDKMHLQHNKFGKTFLINGCGCVNRIRLWKFNDLIGLNWNFIRTEVNLCQYKQQVIDFFAGFVEYDAKISCQLLVLKSSSRLSMCRLWVEYCLNLYVR